MDDAEVGFTLLETIIVSAIASAFTLVTIATLGARQPRAHTAALGLEAALTEARGLAAATADVRDRETMTGATVVVEPVSVPGAYASRISVFRSRPIRNPNAFAATAALVPEAVGERQVAAQFSLVGAAPIPAGRFTIFVGADGDATILTNFGVADLGRRLGRDPGCGVRAIAADDGIRRETHPFSCRDAAYDTARIALPSGGAAADRF